MPDGTILILEKVTVGTSHQFEWQRDQTVADWINGNWTQKYVANAGTQGESIVVWFSRRHPASDAPLDVDWWLRSAALDDAGTELDDDNAGRDSFTASGSSGVGGTRPFTASMPGAKYEMIVAHSAWRPFRHSGNSFKLRVFDTHGDVVAEFDVPHTMSATLPVWTPESLPATKKADDLDVTLTRLAVDSHEITEGTRKRTSYNIRPVLTVSRDGEAEATPSVHEIEFEDAFGNTASQWNCRLNLREPAWKLKIKLWPGGQAPSPPASEWTVRGMTLSEATKAVPVRQSKLVDGLRLEFVAVGGSGKVVYTDTAPARSGGTSSSSGGAIGDASYRIAFQASGGTATTTVDCTLPHLLLRVAGADPDHRLVVRVWDEQGREVPVQQAPVMDQMVVVFLQPAADAKAINVTFMVQQPKKVEFFVEPPRVGLDAESDESPKE